MNVTGDTPRLDPRVRLTRDELRSLLVVSNAAGLGAFAFDVLCIVGVIALAAWRFNPLTYVLAVVVIGARQHALMVLMHEAAHKGLFSRPRVSVVFAELFLAWPFGFSMFGYRSTHWAHHRELNTEDDPDWARNKLGPKPEEFRFPKTNARLAALFGAYLTGLRTLDSLRSLSTFGAEAPGQRRGALPGWAQPVYYLLLAGLLTWAGAWSGFLLYWVVPFLTVTKFIVMFRTYAEHFGIEQGGRYDQDGTRTVVPSALERFVLWPHNINYHVEHHEFPGVRFDKLPRAHALLRAKGRYEGVKVYSGVVEIWREFNGTSARP